MFPPRRCRRGVSSPPSSAERCPESDRQRLLPARDLERVRLAVVSATLRLERSVFPPLLSAYFPADIVGTQAGKIRWPAGSYEGAHLPIDGLEQGIEIRRRRAADIGDAALEQRGGDVGILDAPGAKPEECRQRGAFELGPWGRRRLNVANDVPLIDRPAGAIAQLETGVERARRTVAPAEQFDAENQQGGIGRTTAIARRRNGVECNGGDVVPASGHFTVDDLRGRLRKIVGWCDAERTRRGRRRVQTR